MGEVDLKRLKAAIRAEPDFIRPFVQGQLQGSDGDGGSDPNVAAWCSCGRCQVFTDPRMNVCCRQSPCITLKQEFRNLCLRHDVLEVANILNWRGVTKRGTERKGKENGKRNESFEGKQNI